MDSHLYWETGSIRQCKLVATAKCSRFDSCCTDECTARESGYTCREEADCKKASSCDGQSYKCPTSASKAPDTSCAAGSGRCADGRCSQSLCPTGKEPCMCTDTFSKPTGNNTLFWAIANSCKLCCESATSCVPWLGPNGKPTELPYGASCMQDKGSCAGLNGKSACQKYEDPIAITCVDKHPTVKTSDATFRTLAEVSSTTTRHSSAVPHESPTTWREVSGSTPGAGNSDGTTGGGTTDVVIGE